MIKIFNFNNGIAFPSRGRYEVRRGKNLAFIEVGGIYILKNFCRVNTYRYPFVIFSLKTHTLVRVYDSIENISKYTH